MLENGIWGHPELYNLYFLRPRGDDESDRREMAAAFDEAVRLCHEMGGGMEYCHGAGVRLAHHLPAELGEGLDVYRKVKQALDPKSVLPALGRKDEPPKSP